MDVSIIIVTYNTRQMTMNCIESIFKKTHGVEFEIILVDNASNDDSKNVFEKDSRIKYVYLNENVGFGKGNNVGFKYASGKYIFLLNSDTLLVNDAVTEMFRYMENAPENIGCCGCLLQDRDGNIIHSYHKYFPSIGWIFQEVLCYSIPKIWNPYKKDLSKYKYEHFPLNVEQITGADLFIRKSIIEKYGLFDPDFFMYYEETEMQHRFFVHGYTSVIIETPQIIHLAGASSTNKKNYLRKYNLVLNGRYIYASKIFTPLQYFLFRLMHFLMLPRVLLSKSTLKDKINTLSIILKGVKKLPTK